MSSDDRVRVEVHPLAALLPPTEKRWRVMIGDLQHSTHESEEEAESTAESCRQRMAAATKKGWGPASGADSRGGTAKRDWRR